MTQQLTVENPKFQAPNSKSSFLTSCQDATDSESEFGMTFYFLKGKRMKIFCPDGTMKMLLFIKCYRPSASNEAFQARKCSVRNKISVKKHQKEVWSAVRYSIFATIKFHAFALYFLGFGIWCLDFSVCFSLLQSTTCDNHSLKEFEKQPIKNSHKWSEIISFDIQQEGDASFFGFVVYFVGIRVVK